MKSDVVQHAANQLKSWRSARPAATPSACSMVAAILLLLAVLALPEPSAQSTAAATELGTMAAGPQQPVSLRDRLIVGLRARLKSELAFVERVVMKVEAGQIPQRIVDETFFWARDKAAEPRQGGSRRPIIYFRPALTLRAKAIGVVL